jgi:TRAP-type transport system periplasmic protein
VIAKRRVCSSHGWNDPVDMGASRAARYRGASAIFRICAVHAAAVAVASVVGMTSAQAQVASAKVAEFRLSMALGPTYPLGHAGERWAQLVNEKAAGAFEVGQYPGATLAMRDPAREFGALKDGLCDLAVGSALAWSAQLPPLAVYSIPFLAPELREQQALAADVAVRGRIFALMESAGVVGLAMAPLGEHVLATAKAPIESLADAQGLRVRVMPIRAMIDVYIALGALPHSMSFASAQAALAAGTLDGQDTFATTLVATRATASGQKFVTRWGAFSDVMIFAVRKTAWDTWPEDRRALFRDTALQAAQEADALAREEAALEQLHKEGVTIVRLSTAQRAALREAAQSAITSWTNAVGIELANAARAAAAGK